MQMTDSERQAKRWARLKGRYGRNFSMVLGENGSLVMDRLFRSHGRSQGGDALQADP